MPLTLNTGANPELSVSLPLRLPTGPCYGPEGLDFLNMDPRAASDSMIANNTLFAYYGVIALALQQALSCDPTVAAIMRATSPLGRPPIGSEIRVWLIAYKFLAVRGCREWRARSGTPGANAAIKSFWDAYRAGALDIYNEAPQVASICDQACALLG